MAIVNNKLDAGLDGGTFICTGTVDTARTYTKVFKGFQVVTSIVELTSLLDNNGVNVTGSVLLNGTATDLSTLQFGLNTGDIVTPTGSYNFTGLTFNTNGNQKQIVLYLTGSNN
jgi:hypothetical protein